MEEDRSGQTLGQFQPRLGGPQAAAPFNPNMYFPLAIVGGTVGISLFAALNLKRITLVQDMDRKTWALIIGLNLALLCLLAVAPGSWWDSSNIRLSARLLAVAGSVPLYWLHRGPALGRQQHYGHYQSLWKFWWQIALAWIVHGVAISAVGLARGVL